MNAEKIYEKAEKRLTISGKCGTIFKQSAQTASHLRCPWGCANRICEGGGTGRRARLRCVWFILGGSSPLPRTRKTLRDIEENSMFRGAFFLSSCQIPFPVSIRSWAGYAPPAAWHRLQGSNLRHPVLETGSLPAELRRHEKSTMLLHGALNGGQRYFLGRSLCSVSRIIFRISWCSAAA